MWVWWGSLPTAAFGRCPVCGLPTATAHKIAVIFYAMVKNQVEYDKSIWEKRDTQRRERHTASLKRQAERLGYRLTPIQEENAA
jgi:hypothetical protein